jgi:hypothetical protein
MKQLLISFLTIIIAFQANCQAIEVDKTIKIGWENQSSFYAKGVNCFQITASRDPMSTLVFRSTQGKLENEDSGIVNGRVKLSGLKLGKVTVSVYRKNDTRLEFLNYRDFYVIPKPMWDNVSKIQDEPEIDIEGYGKNHDDCKPLFIPLSVLRKARKLNIRGPYQITEITIFINRPYTFSCNIDNWHLKSNYFDADLLRVFSHISKDVFINIDEIKIKDSKGKEYSLSPRYYRITDD